MKNLFSTLFGANSGTPGRPVLPLSIGIETLGGVFTPLLRKDSPLPTKTMQVFSTAEDDQHTVTVRVLRGEHQLAANNLVIGQFDLQGIAPAPRGVPQIEVTFDVNLQGELSVTARDAATKKEYSTRFTSDDRAAARSETRPDGAIPSPEASRDKVFLSYRRSDTQMIAGRIYDRLVTAFGKGKIFYDVDAIPFGVDFRSHINSSISQCYCLVALIGSDWTGASSAPTTRIHDETDFVRTELELALNANIRIIPVLIGAARMPSPADLPPTLANFCYLNAARIDVGPDFHPNMDRIIQALQHRT